MAAVTLTSADHLAIQQLYARQSHAIDGGDADGWAATFTPSGSFVSPTYDRPYRGTGALREFAEAFHRAAREAGVTRRHWTTALHVEAGGTDAAVARCYALVLATPRGGTPRIERAVVLHDRLARTSHGWRVAEREVVVDGA